MKKNLLTIAIATALTVATAMPTFAAEWLLDRNAYTNLHDWGYAEADAQAKKWATEHKGNIASITDEVERYKAVVKEVCDFLTYDIRYMQPHIYYTIRDGKGVCGDYQTLTDYLCKEVGITCESMLGAMNGVEHGWSKVTLNGVVYYSDVTNVDSGLTEQLLMSVLPASHVEQYPTTGIARSTGADTGDAAERAIAVPDGMNECVSPNGQVFYITDADLNAYVNDEITPEQLLEKYGVQ